MGLMCFSCPTGLHDASRKEAMARVTRVIQLMTMLLFFTRLSDQESAKCLLLVDFYGAVSRLLKL